MTVIDHKNIANDPRLGWLDKMQAIAFSYFLSLDTGERPIELPDLHLYDWCLGRTAVCNVTAWRFPG